MEKNTLAFNIISFESGTANSASSEHDTCHHQSICWQTPVRFQISIREIFSKSFPLRVVKKYDKSAAMQILQVFGTL